jgi:hypothetical protein
VELSFYVIIRANYYGIKFFIIIRNNVLCREYSRDIIIPRCVILIRNELSWVSWKGVRLSHVSYRDTVGNCSGRVSSKPVRELFYFILYYSRRNYYELICFSRN